MRLTSLKVHLQRRLHSIVGSNPQAGRSDALHLSHPVVGRYRLPLFRLENAEIEVEMHFTPPFGSIRYKPRIS